MSDGEKVHRNESPPSDSYSTAQHEEKVGVERDDVFDVQQDQKLAAVFENPLAGVPRETLLKNVEEFCQQNGLMDDIEIFRKGALVAQRPHAVQEMDDLTAEDKEQLAREHTHKWDQPWMLYFLVSMSSMAAAVQGMDGDYDRISILRTIR